MDNKYTRTVDDFFEKFASKKEDRIFLGFCHSGDEDGGTGDHDCILDTYEADPAEAWPYDMAEKCVGFSYLDDIDGSKMSHEEKVAQDNEFKKELSKLFKLFGEGFPKELEPNYGGTDCQWRNCYYITKDYKIGSIVTRGDINLNEDDHLDILVDFSAFSEFDAEMKMDREIYGKINQYIKDIKFWMAKIRHHLVAEEVYKLAKTIEEEDSKRRVIPGR